MDIETKIKSDMRKLGCLSHHQISLAFHLYLYLVDEKLMYDTEYCYNKDIDLLYIVARPTKKANLNIYVPMPTSDDLNLDYIALVQDNLCTIETGPTVNLAFIDGDLSTVIYTFTKDMCPRQAAEIAKKNLIHKEQRGYINNELYKKRDEILDNALNGGPVDNYK